jgi:O-antigen ligase
VRAVRLPLGGADALLPALGAALIVFASFASVQVGAGFGLGLAVAVSFLLASVTAFVVVPHYAVAVTIPLFALLPAVKALALPTVGAVKDVVTLAAAAAAVLVIVVERRRPDRWVLVTVTLLLLLYGLNLGGGHDVAWAQGVRLTAEPLLLLVAGLALPHAARTLRLAMPVLVATACVAAVYGLLQQVVGPAGLVSWGYSYAQHVRTYDGYLRSFGTFDEPFAYAAFLLSGLAAVLFWMRRGPRAYAAAGLITAGLAVSLVRTAALVMLALVGLWLARHRLGATGVLVLAAAVVAMGAILVTQAGATESRTYSSGSSVLTLNGRTSAWQAALGSPQEWPLGRGVGEVGTAATRATYTIAPRGAADAQTSAVDSGYLATIADVGVVGVAVLVALFARLLALAGRAIRRGHDEGWLAAAFLTVLLLDAVTRASFTGFPTAFLGLLLVGVALASARDVDEWRARHAAPPVR